MNKKTIIILIIAVFAVIGIFSVINRNRGNSNQISDYGDNQSSSSSEIGDITSNNTKILVVYFSAQNHTRNVANTIAQKLNANTFEIKPKKKYSDSDLNYDSSNSRVSREYNNESLRNIELESTNVPNWDNYNTIVLGYPIWWGIAAWPTNSFVKSQNFTGKTIVPFCTSISSDIGESAMLLEEENRTGYWEAGYRFSSNPTDADIDDFISRISRDPVAIN